MRTRNLNPGACRLRRGCHFLGGGFTPPVSHTYTPACFESRCSSSDDCPGSGGLIGSELTEENLGLMHRFEDRRFDARHAAAVCPERSPRGNIKVANNRLLRAYCSQSKIRVDWGSKSGVFSSEQFHWLWVRGGDPDGSGTCNQNGYWWCQVYENSPVQSFC